jgi:hypothetical protein
MTDDVLARLRRADPCPEPPTYPEATITAMMRTILDDEAHEALELPSGGAPRELVGWRRHRAMLLSAGLVLAIAAGLAIALHDNFRATTPATVATPATTPPPRPGLDWGRFTDNGVSFRYPPAWRSYPYTWSSSFSSSLTYLSTREIPNPCKTTHPNGNTEISCGLPATRLSPDGVLIIWTETGFPHAAGSPDALEHAPGELTTIAGHAARVLIGAAGQECGHIGASTSIQAVIARDPRPAYETLHMTACLGPDNQSANTRAVLAMLGTVRIAH